MRNYSFLLLIVINVFSVSCYYRYPSSVRGTVVSTTTGYPIGYGYFDPEYNYGGFNENELIIEGSKKWSDTLNLTKKERKAQSKAQWTTIQKVIVGRSLDSIKGNPVPGAVYIGPLQLYADETEVANIHWQEFMYYINRDSVLVHELNLLPDTSVIKLNKSDYYYYGLSPAESIKPITSYFYHPEYLYYPVVGVSHEQAVAYCKWRSKVVTAQHNTNPKSKQKLKINYRLPTEQEWEVIAAGGLDKKKLPFASYTGLNVRYKVNPKAASFIAKKTVEPKSIAQIEQDLKETEVHDQPLNVKRPLPYFLQFRTPAYVYGGIPNDYGLFHILGNVAEMVAEKGIAKGGNWKYELSNSKITDRQLYTTPSDKVGFRCVCEVELMK